MKLLKILLPFLLLCILIVNSTFASVSHVRKELKEITHSARKLGAKTQEGIKDLAHALSNVIGNQVGAAGRNVDDLVKASKAFTSNPKKASQFINSMKPFKGSNFTETERNLTKHPKVMGYESTEVMRKTQSRYGKIIKYRLDNGYGARFFEESNEMIGFIEP